ncbi:hypothetical protein JNJ66_00175 [Candidatus Saccharibacteria bacterium]|nr:hypothetical protein [Candidatus Saccharibacteria bacterium]
MVKKAVSPPAQHKNRSKAEAAEAAHHRRMVIILSIVFVAMAFIGLVVFQAINAGIREQNLRGFKNMKSAVTEVASGVARKLKTTAKFSKACNKNIMSYTTLCSAGAVITVPVTTVKEANRAIDTSQNFLARHRPLENFKVVEGVYPVQIKDIGHIADDRSAGRDNGGGATFSIRGIDQDTCQVWYNLNRKEPKVNKFVMEISFECTKTAGGLITKYEW